MLDYYSILCCGMILVVMGNRENHVSVLAMKELQNTRYPNVVFFPSNRDSFPFFQIFSD